MSEHRLTKAQERYLPILYTLCDYHPGFLSFATIAADTGFDRRTVRLGCRLFARKGLAEFANALSDDDGGFKGAGYAITSDGIAALAKAERQP